METRKVKVNHDNPVKFRDLTEDQKMRHNIFAKYLVMYCTQNIGTTIRWEDIDNHIPHLYGFVFDNYNANHQNTQMIFDDNGVTCVRIRRTK